jgi:excisionase family DNA binding protein
MAGLRVERGVVLTGPHLEAARAAVQLAAMSYDRKGGQTPRVLVELGAMLAGPCPARDSHKALAEQHQDMTTRQAAEVLEVSERTVRRLAPGLGGHKVAGRLVLDAAAVHQHREGMDS